MMCPLIFLSVPPGETSAHSSTNPLPPNKSDLRFSWKKMKRTFWKRNEKKMDFFFGIIIIIITLMKQKTGKITPD